MTLRKPPLRLRKDFEALPGVERVESGEGTVTIFVTVPWAAPYLDYFRSGEGAERVAVGVEVRVQLVP